LIGAGSAERAAGQGRAARRTSATMTIRLALRLLLRDIPRAAIGVVILLAIAINFANIIGRYVFLSPLPWAEEVLVFLVIWGVCLGASAVTYDNRHLDMDLFVVRFPPRLRVALAALQLVAMVGFCAFTAVNAWTIVALMARNGQVSITAGIPMTIPYAAFVTGFALIAVAAVAGAVERRLERQARCAPSPQPKSHLPDFGHC
jgi:TRAP-type C4-dicarboxylate transport system permease small subunit